ncbi:hypothetical protein CPB83DRAFT_861008 [Crepidotus variabilis]|uniref:PWWP domain-containing protein n=1 Tax=Crepidotus variabilis TaxID=179855 RepID=A0A9P6E8Y1_9AGAR|nr:hypothetical protein CPB83DRAFT_861008 [Crepidotus variabilis]
MSKKGAKGQKEFRPYSVGDPVLGKIRGYPPWPGVIFDPAEAPKNVRNEQPPGKKSPAHCVLFFPSGDYAWIHPKDLSSLKRHEIEAYLADEGKKRNGELREGYRIALDPHEWLSSYDKKRAAEAQLEQEAQETVDQLDSEEDGVADDSKKAKSTKKRKRDPDDAPTKEKKPPKAKRGSAEPSKKKSASTGNKAKKNGTKSKAMVESEDDGDHAEANGEDDDAGPSHKNSPPPAKKTKREKEDEEDAKLANDPQAIKVRDWRHKLQKVFLSNKTIPRAEAMPEIDQLVTTIETYDQMTIEQLQFSKIGKVMRHVAALPPEKIPRDSEFHFRTRAKALVEKWQEILNAHKQTSPPPLSAPPTAAESLKHAMNGAADAGVKSDSEEVTQGAKNLDLNGKDESMLSIDIGDQTLVDADAPGEVAMSEA